MKYLIQFVKIISLQSCNEKKSTSQIQVINTNKRNNRIQIIDLN
jgi:hypothetical protein